MSSVAKKEIILVPGAEVTVKQVGANQLLTIYEPVDEPELVIVWDGNCKNAAIKDKQQVSVNREHVVPFESIEQYKSILRGEYRESK